MDNNLNPFYPIVVVDDEPLVLYSIKRTLETGGFNNVITCSKSREVFTICSHEKISLILLDLKMPELSGEEILERLSIEYPATPVIILTAHRDIEAVVRCIKQGALDFITKPINKERLLSVIRLTTHYLSVEEENVRLRNCLLSKTLEHIEAFNDIVTNNETLFAIFQYVEAVAKTNQPILITGESGVGKELIARAIHRVSGKSGEFVAVNIAGLDDFLFTDTLFGHEKGSYTSADSTRKGLIERAAGGTLFLDEIGDLSPVSQVKILRLIQEREYFPLGSDIPRKTDTKLVLSTHKNLKQLCTTNAFRNDLYYRLCTHHVHIPPLRERREDIPLLLDYFLDKAATSLEISNPTPPPELYTLLLSYHFPGNVRELEAMVFDAVSQHKSHKLSMNSFQAKICVSASESQPDQFIHSNKDSIFNSLQPLPHMDEVKLILIQAALKRCDGNYTLAAKMIGITRQSISKYDKHDSI